MRYSLHFFNYFALFAFLSFSCFTSFTLCHTAWIFLLLFFEMEPAKPRKQPKVINVTILFSFLWGWGLGTSPKSLRECSGTWYSCITHNTPTSIIEVMNTTGMVIKHLNNHNACSLCTVYSLIAKVFRSTLRSMGDGEIKYLSDTVPTAWGTLSSLFSLAYARV